MFVIFLNLRKSWLNGMFSFRMQRTRVWRTDREISHDMEDAGTEVIKMTDQLEASLKNRICHVSLHRFCVMLRKNENPKKVYRPYNWDFDSKQEQVLRDCVKRAADLYYALANRQLKDLRIGV